MNSTLDSLSALSHTSKIGKLAYAQCSPLFTIGMVVIMILFIKPRSKKAKK